MKRFNTMNIRIKPIVAACALALAAGQAGAIDYTLATKAYTKQLPMADGTLVDVPMWGYVIDPDNDASGRGDCYETANFTARGLCVDALPDPVAPGPQLTMDPGETALRIFLTNRLPTQTSIVIPGQELPYSATDNGPTWNDGSTGARGADLTKKVRSYGREAGPNAGRRAYIWTNFRTNPITNSGTFMYHSGTNPQLQTYMGLYGAVTKDAAAGEVYPGVAYTNEATLFYSDIDPVHNAAVAAGDTTYTPIDYHAKWFLINGEPYVDGMAPITVGAAGESTLLRFLSAAGEKHVPVIQGLHGTIHAEDGIQYTWQDGTTGVETTAPRVQYSVGLPPLKTKDVIINPNADGLYAVYDGNGFMTNPSDPEVFTQGDTVGGMLRFLEVGPATVGNPVAVDDAYTATEDLPLSETAPGVLLNDTDATTPEAQLVIQPANGSVVLNIDGSFVYTPNLDLDTTDSFTYQVLDTTTGLTSNVATVSIGITPVNDAPTIVSTPVLIATVNELYSYDVDATDPDTGDVLTYSLDTGAIAAGMSIDSLTGLISWTPTVAGLQPVTVTVTDTATTTATQIFNVDVAGVVAESPPTAVADAYSVNEDAILDTALDGLPGVLANDIPTDGDAMTATLVSGPSCAWTAGPSGAGAFVLNADGSFHYEPIPNWNSSLIAENPFCPGVSGPDTFTYEAVDNDGNSNTVTVEITVNEMNDAPVAADDVLTMTAMNSITFPAPSVLANDNDVDLIPFDPAQVFAVRETEPNRGSIPDWPLNGDETTAGADGNFTYEFANIRVGVIATFDYHATDTQADSNTSTVTIRRELSVANVELEIDTEAGVGKWNIQGRISNQVPNGSVIEASLNGVTVIGTHTEQGGQQWGIVNEDGPIPAVGDTIDVRVITNLGDPEAQNAFILGYPVP